MCAKEIIMKNQKAAIHGEAASHVTVAVLFQGLKINDKNKPSYITNCKFCSSPHVRDLCPTYGKRWNNCGPFNHFAKACCKEAKSGKKTLQKLYVRFSDHSDDDFEVYGVQFKAFGLNHKQGWFSDTIVNDHKNNLPSWHWCTG